LISPFKNTLKHKVTVFDANSDANVFIGNTVSDASMNTTLNNVGVGFGSLGALVSGNNNVAIGKEALKLITTGGENIAIGALALDAADATETGNISIIIS
jgi:hypothetical protein